MIEKELFLMKLVVQVTTAIVVKKSVMVLDSQRQGSKLGL